MEADKPTVGVDVRGTTRVEERQTEAVVERRTELDEERERGVKTLEEEVGVMNQPELTRWDLKLSLRRSVERQAPHGPNRLKKQRAESVEDRSSRPELAEEDKSRIG